MPMVSPMRSRIAAAIAGVVMVVALADAIRARVRDALVVQASIELVPFGTLARSEYKSKLVDR